MRTQILMVLVLAVSLLSISPILVAQESTDDERVTELIDAYIEALGGRMSVDTESIKIVGVNRPSKTGRDGEPTSDLTLLYKDGKFGIEMNRRSENGDDSFYGYDSSGQWRTKHGSTKTKFVSENQCGWMKAIPFVAQQALHWQDWGKEITRTEDTTFGDEEVATIVIQLSKTRRVTHYFSKVSGLLVGSEVDIGAIHLVHYEYIEIEGMQCVSAARIKNSKGGEGLYDFEFSQFDFVSTISDEEFKRPEKEK